MVTFSHLDAGTPADTWADSPALIGAAPLPIPLPHLIVFAAHPDDETLGAGALIRRVMRSGGSVDVVVATLGENSHPDSPTHSPGRLAELREAEVRAAVTLLAPEARVRLLGLPDGGLSRHRDALREAVVGILAEAGPAATAACPWRRDGHTDHDTLGEVVAAAAAEAGVPVLEYPIWLWHWGTPADLPEGIVRLDATVAERAAKADAMALHITQVRPLSDRPGDEALLGDRILAHFRGGTEYFVSSGHRDAAPAADAAGVFEDLHARSSDPWRVESWYERRKRAVTIAALPSERYRSALEVGCSVGALAADLAERADALLAVDVSETAVRAANERLGGLPHALARRAALPEEWPDGRFDLVMLSEVGYFCTQEQLDGILRRIGASLEHGGHLVGCHWSHPVDGWPLDGADVHRTIHASGLFRPLLMHEERDFLLEVFERRPA